MDKFTALSQEQKTGISAEGILSLGVLSMASSELASFLEREYQENPMLELAPCGGAPGGSHEYAFDSVPAPAERGFTRDVLMQLDRRDFSADEWRMLRVLAEALDDDGFFTLDELELARLIGVSGDTAERCLESLKKLEPPGIFSRGASECVLEQLRRRGEADENVLFVAERFMPEILAGDLGAVLKRSKLSESELKRCLQKIGGLEPYPLRGGGADPEYITPDVTVSISEDGGDISVRAAESVSCAVSREYSELLRSGVDEELREYLTQKLRRAKTVIACVEKRRATLLRISELLCWEQRAYLFQNGSLRRLTELEAARRLGVSPSTLSRAVSGKYMLAGARVVRMSGLFSRSDFGRGGERISGDELKKRMLTLLADEQPGASMSDAALAERLSEGGALISRRTVAKYRKALGILDSRRRKYYEPVKDIKKERNNEGRI